MKVRLLFVLYSLLFLQKSFTQTSIAFEVLDQVSEKALFHAHVQLLDPEKRNILQFGTTDKNGRKTFENITKDSLLVVVSHLGFLKEERLVAASMNEQVFRLIPNTQNLEEVTITSYPRSFTIQEDTLSYNLKAVIDGTERNLGEALKKLPGIEVDDKGIVKHQGKKLDHILVDGNNFFGNKHQMATQNLRPEMIEQAEIISNYSESPLQSKGSKTVLNLSMHEEYKHKFIGDFAANYGVKDKYAGHGNFFRFVDNGNLSVIADFNTIGETPITLEDYMEMRGGISEFVKSSGTNQVTKLDSKQFPSFVFNDENFIDRKSNFVTLNYTRNSEKLKINGYSYLHHSKQRESIFKNKTFLNETNLQFNELFSDRSNGLANATYLKLGYLPNENNHWNMQLNFNPNQDTSNEDIETIEEKEAVSYFTRRKSHNFNLGYHLSYEGRLGENLILTSAFTQNYSSNKKDLNSHSTVPFLFYNSKNTVFQKYRLKNLTSHWNVDLEYQRKQDRYKLSYAYLNEREDLMTEVFETEFYNSLNITNQTSSFSFYTTNYLSSKWVVASENKLNFYHSNYQDTPVKVRYEPMLNLSYLFSFSHKLSLSGVISNRNFGVSHLMQHPIFLDYRTVLKSEIKENDVLSNSRNIVLNYMHFKPRKEMVLNLDIGYRYSKNNIILTNSFTDNTIINQYVFSPSEEDYNLGIRMDRRFRKIPFSLKNMLRFNHIKSENYLDDNPSIQTNNSFIYRAELFSHFKSKLLQFELGLEYNRKSLEQSYNKSIAKISDFTSFLKFKGLLKERVIWDLKFTNLLQKSPLGRNHLFYISPSIHIDSENKKWTYSLYGNNILNLKDNKKLVSRFTNISMDNTETSILDGYLLIGVKYNL